VAANSVYYYDGQRVIAVHSGSGDVLREVVRGTQYIDEVIRERLAASGLQSGWAGWPIHRIARNRYGVPRLQSDVEGDKGDGKKVGEREQVPF